MTKSAAPCAVRQTDSASNVTVIEQGGIRLPQNDPGHLQRAARNRCGGRSGICAVGALANLLLSGKRIFHEASGDDLHMRIVHSAPSPLDYAQAVPAGLTDLVMQCLAKCPKERPANAARPIVTREQLASSAPWSQVEAAQG